MNFSTFALPLLLSFGFLIFLQDIQGFIIFSYLQLLDFSYFYYSYSCKTLKSFNYILNLMTLFWNCKIPIQEIQIQSTFAFFGLNIILKSCHHIFHYFLTL